MAEKIALITGVTGQDGVYLTDFLLGKGYVVHGTTHRAVDDADGWADRLPRDDARFVLHECDVGDFDALTTLVHRTGPAEIYNLAADSDVALSFEEPRRAADVNAMGALHLLDAIRVLGLERRTRFYQASTAALFGNATADPQDETTPMHPHSPFAVAKLHAYWITVNFREAFGLHASNGILFNHESPYRPETRVARKIARTVAAIALGLERKLAIGNLHVARDWGHARDYVEGMWLMLQQPAPDDYVLATGETHTVREFIDAAFACVGTAIEWHGAGAAEKGVNALTGDVLVEVDPQFLRKAEIYRRRGNPAKARDRLGWRHRTSFAELVREMVEHDLGAFERERGFAGRR